MTADERRGRLRPTPEFQAFPVILSGTDRTIQCDPARAVRPVADSAGHGQGQAHRRSLRIQIVPPGSPWSPCVTILASLSPRAGSRHGLQSRLPDWSRGIRLLWAPLDAVAAKPRGFPPGDVSMYE
jgi:hypothetical protein